MVIQFNMDWHGRQGACALTNALVSSDALHCQQFKEELQSNPRHVFQMMTSPSSN